MSVEEKRALITQMFLRNGQNKVKEDTKEGEPIASFEQPGNQVSNEKESHRHPMQA